MHLNETHEGPAARTNACSGPPFGPGFDPETVERIEKLEVHGSSIGDPGSDFCVFKAFDAEGQEIGSRRLAGY